MSNRTDTSTRAVDRNQGLLVAGFVYSPLVLLTLVGLVGAALA